MVADLPGWRNGIRKGLKILDWHRPFSLPMAGKPNDYRRSARRITNRPTFDSLPWGSQTRPILAPLRHLATR